MANASRLAETFKKGEETLLSDWLAALKKAGGDGRISEADLQTQARQFLGLVVAAVPSGLNIDAPAWAEVQRFLEDTSRSRALQGFTSSETALFIFSLRAPLLTRLRADLNDPGALQAATSEATELIDALGLQTVKAFQKSREAIIARQQEELLELSTPVVKLWDGILALPMIGTLDSARTQVVMESLLQRIVETGSEVAIIDITGVPTVDTLVAQHLLKTVTAIRLMGADCIISGIRPQIAQTIVHLGVDLRGVTTKATLADALGGGARALGSDGGQEARAVGDSAPVERIPILRMGDLLLVTIQVDMHDRLAMTLQDDLTVQIQRLGAKGVLIDISALDMVDSFIGRMIANLSRMSRILDARTVVVGMRPAVAITLVELGLEPGGRRHGARCRTRHEVASVALATYGSAGWRSRATEVFQVRTEQDIVLARQAVRRLSQAIGFGLVDQTKIVTAASELARNVVVYGLGGTMTLRDDVRRRTKWSPSELRRSRARHRESRAGDDRRVDVGHRHGPGPVWREAARQRVRDRDRTRQGHASDDRALEVGHGCHNAPSK